MMSRVQQVACGGRGGGSAVNDSRDPEFLPAANGHHRGEADVTLPLLSIIKVHHYHHYSQSLLGLGGSSPPAVTFPMLFMIMIVILSFIMKSIKLNI